MLTIATWNINSVRLRAELVLDFLQKWQPDVLCLQETKCPQGQFPLSKFAEAGYRHLAERGQSGYHGVAIISRIPFAKTHSLDFCGKQDARHVAARLADSTAPVIHNFYVPAGGDEPDPEINEKFAHKLAFLDEMRSMFARQPASSTAPSVLVGDLNIAPFEHDVWSHKQLLKVVSHTPVEVAALEALRTTGQWVDVMRKHIPHDQKLYTWWSYRAKDWSAADKGRRLDHIWLDASLAKKCPHVEVIREARGWERPSDHAPVIAQLSI